MLNKLSSKMKKIIVGCMFGTTGLWLILSLGLSAPGLGYESLKFINSSEAQIEKLFPKGKIVLDGDNENLKIIMESSVKTSYEADLISLLANDPNLTPDYDVQYKNYMTFADEWYTKTWQAKIDAHEDIDLADVGKDFVTFEKASTTKFQSMGYVNPGISWMFHNGGIKEIFSSTIKDNTLYQQTVIDQEVYNNNMKYTGPGMTGLQVQQSPGVMIVNNKVWFINLQREGIVYALDTFGSSIFKDKQLKITDLSAPITVDDMYLPNFTVALGLLQAAVVLFLMWPFVAAGTCTFATLLLLDLKKNK